MSNNTSDNQISLTAYEEERRQFPLCCYVSVHLSSENKCNCCGQHKESEIKKACRTGLMATKVWDESIKERIMMYRFNNGLPQKYER